MSSKDTFDLEIDAKLLERYYRKKPSALDVAVISFLRDSCNPQMVVHGAKAVNAHLPSWLDKETKDWDIFAENSAEELAVSLEHKLDKRYGGNYFAVEPALHPGTFRIRSRVTGEVVADITLQDKVVSFQRIGGVNYVTLQYQRDQANKVLSDPNQAFRHRKDRDTLQRIAVYNAGKKKRKRSKKVSDIEIPTISSIRM